MATRYWIGNSGDWTDTAHWSATSGGAGGATEPGDTDAVIFDANSITADGASVASVSDTGIGSLDLSALTNTVNLVLNAGVGDLKIHGNFTGSSKATFPASTNGISLLPTSGDTLCNFTQNGTTINVSLTVGHTGDLNDFILFDDLVIASDKTLFIIGDSDAVFYGETFDITAGYVDISGSPEVQMGTGTWTVKPTGSVSDPVWSVESTVDLDAGTSTIYIDATLVSAGVCTFSSLTTAHTYYNVEALLDFSEQLTFDTATNTTFQNLTLAGGTLPTVKFKSSTTLIITDTLTAHGTGTGANSIQFLATTNGVAATLSAAVADVSYINVKDNTAAGAGILFDDSLGGTDNGNNTNWYFGSLPTNNVSVTTSMARVVQNTPFPQYVIGSVGGSAGTTYGLFKKTTTYGITTFRSELIPVGGRFDVISVEFSLIPGVAAGMQISPILHFDDGTSTSTGTSINVSNYPNADKIIRLNSKNFANTVRGQKNFFLELRFIGLVLAVVELPIKIVIDTIDT